jgi:hypothetical protein
LLALHFTEALSWKKLSDTGFGRAEIGARFANVSNQSPQARLEMRKRWTNPLRGMRENGATRSVGLRLHRNARLRRAGGRPDFDRARSLFPGAVENADLCHDARAFRASYRARRFSAVHRSAAQAMQFARQVDDAGILMEALFWGSRFYRGDFASAAVFCSRALRLR